MKNYYEFVNEELNLNPFKRKIDWDRKLIDYINKGSLKGVKQALDNGADIHYKDCLALRWASFNGHLEIVKYLIDKGADIHVYYDDALRSASYHGHLEIVKYLSEKGADIHAENDDALRSASLNSHLKVVKYLCELIIQKEPWYIPKIMEYIPEELKEKYAHLIAGADMDLL